MMMRRKLLQLLQEVKLTEFTVQAECVAHLSGITYGKQTVLRQASRGKHHTDAFSQQRRMNLIPSYLFHTPNVSRKLLMEHFWMVWMVKHKQMTAI